MKSKRKTPDIRFRGFTDDWEQRTLGDVIDSMYNGQTPSRFKDENWNGEINWLSSGELNRGIVTETIEKITPEGQKDANLKVVPAGTFVMAITGLEAAGTRGNCAKLAIDTTLNQSCMAFFSNEKLLDSEFLFQWYRKVGEEYGIRYTQGTKQQSYNAELIKILPITLPKVEEQRKISKVLDNIDTLITLHQRKLQQLKEVKRGMLLKMFPRKNLLLPEIRFSEYTKKWEICSLDKIGKIETGNTPPTKDKGNYSDEGLLWITPTDIQSIITTKSEKMLTKKGADVARVVNGGSILFTCIASIGKNTMVLENAAFNQQINALTPNNITHSYFILAQSGFLSKKMNAMAASGTMKIINKTEFSKIKIYHTCLEEQEKIGFFFEKLDRMIELQEREIELLEQTKKGFLQKMFV